MSSLTPVVRTGRMLWRRLTSMRTALVLLFLLAVAAVPGSLLPQRPLNPDQTNSYISAHGAWGRFLDAIGMFDVFGSFWFAAIYLLLFISLVGCLVPRIKVHARAVARKPLKAPRNLDRLPESGGFKTPDDPTAYAAAARAALGRRWRVAEREEPGGVLTLSAEKGYSRETGNLIFHVALLVSLVLIAVGRLYTYQGSVIVKEGSGFCNTVSQYDSWRPGRFAAEGKVGPAPFCVDDLRKFTATYGPDGEPSQFRADVRYRKNVDAQPQNTSITVNHPLRLEGDRLYLINHGYAPRITVTRSDGSVQTDTQVFIPSNPSTFFSEGAFKEQGKPDADQDIGISGFFAPTPIAQPDGTIASASPKVQDPVLGVFVYRGDLTGSGAAQSVYALDTSKMKKIGQANLTVGQTEKLPGGVTVRFDGYSQWAGFQVSHDPAQGYLLISALAMVLGLLGSLGVRRRRVWIRVRAQSPDPEGLDPAGSRTVVSVGGLARSDSGNFTTEFAALLDRLRDASRPVPADAPAPAEPDPIGAGKD